MCVCYRCYCCSSPEKNSHRTSAPMRETEKISSMTSQYWLNGNGTDVWMNDRMITNAIWNWFSLSLFSVDRTKHNRKKKKKRRQRKTFFYDQGWVVFRIITSAAFDLGEQRKKSQSLTIVSNWFLIGLRCYKLVNDGRKTFYFVVFLLLFHDENISLPTRIDEEGTQSVLKCYFTGNDDNKEE